MADIHSEHQLSPSSWNRFEECPRKYWLSRQKLPKKASMAASLGNVIHNSMEEICNLNFNDLNDFEVGWLPKIMKDTIDKHWSIEKEIFLNTPRRPNWKSQSISKAREGLVGALNILFSKTNHNGKKFSEISVKDWKEIKSIVLSNEESLMSKDGKLIGRLDLLIDDLDDQGESKGWIVADLKTGKPPSSGLNKNVTRQLLFYRDLLKETKPNHPKVSAEGWYSANQKIYSAEGDFVLDDAINAWNEMHLTIDPPKSTPSEESCGFCEFKAWCPDWWVSRDLGFLSDKNTFRDEVVKIIKFDEFSGAALFERQTPVGLEGELTRSETSFGALIKGRALIQIKNIISTDFESPIFLGSARSQGQIIHLGDWSEILPWYPILKSIRES